MNALWLRRLMARSHGPVGRGPARKSIGHRLTHVELLLLLGLLGLAALVGVALGGLTEMATMLAGLLGIAALGLVILMRPTWGAHVLMGVVYFGDILASLIPGGTLLSAGKGIGVVVVASWLGSQIVQRRLHIVLRRSGALLLGLGLMMALSAVGHWQFQTEAFLLFVTGFIFYLVILNLLTDWRRFESFIKILVGIALLLAILGFSRAQQTDFTARLGARDEGLLADANEFGLVLNMALPFVLVWAARPTRWRWLAAAAGLLLLMTIAITASRGAALASVVTLGVLSVRHRRVRYLSLLGIVLLVVSAPYLPVVSYLWDRFFAADVSTQMSTMERTNAIWAGLDIGLTHPLLGIGPLRWGEFIRTYQHNLPGGVPSSPHNTFIQAFAELGVPGLLLVGSMFAFSLADLWRVQHAPYYAEGDHPWIWAMWAFVLSYMVSIFALNHLYSRDLFIVLGMLDAHVVIAERTLGMAEAATRTPVVPRIASSNR